MVLTWLFSFAIFALVALGMALGLILANKPLKGSCGGLNQGRCELCGATSIEDCDRPEDSPSLR